MKNKRFSGIGTSSGIVMGKVYLFSSGRQTPVKRRIGKENFKEEKAMLRYAVEKTKDEISILRQKIEADFGSKFSQIFNIHLALLDDPMLIPVAEKKIEEGINASYALSEAVKMIIDNLSLHSGQVGRTIEILHDILAKIFHHLGERDYKRLEDIDEKVILVARNITPYDTVSIPKKNIAGILCSMGTQTSHAAILARALRIPAVLGIPNIEEIVSADDILILDGRKGLVIINPGKRENELYQRRKKEEELEAYFKEGLVALPPKTKDGHRINLSANIELPDEVNLIRKENADGIGLFRTEFLFSERLDIPDEEEQTKVYREIGDIAYPHYVTIRTLDIGEDKIALFLKERISSSSLRAIRLLLKYKDIFKTQLRAILRANKRGNIRVMFPMVTTASELACAISLLEEAKNELKKEKVQFEEDIEIGTMIETPSSAIACDTLAPFVDFFSIGTNDLIQYTLVVDRTDPETAYLYEPLHPSIIRLIKNVVEVGHKAGIWVGMCGEMASEPLYTPILLGLDIDELSVNWDAIGRIKEAIRNITMDEAKQITEKALSLAKPDDIRQFLHKHKEAKWKEK
ncbi:MAG: phosphoenolpyruvate--protein phosphotransferase [bacterium]